MESRIFVTAPFPLDLETRARVAAARLRISRAELVRRATESYLQGLAAVSDSRPLSGDTTLDRGACDVIR